MPWIRVWKEVLMEHTQSTQSLLCRPRPFTEHESFEFRVCHHRTEQTAFEFSKDPTEWKRRHLARCSMRGRTSVRHSSWPFCKIGTISVRETAGPSTRASCTNRNVCTIQQSALRTRPFIAVDGGALCNMSICAMATQLMQLNVASGNSNAASRTNM